MLSSLDVIEKDGLYNSMYRTDMLMPASVKSNDTKDVCGLGYDRALNAWTAPFGMSVSNSKGISFRFLMMNDHNIL